jgi:oligopeptide transport system substrate-binding protein
MAGILALSGCAKRLTRVEEGNRSQILHIGNKDEPAELDPHVNAAVSTGGILSALFEGLVEYGNDGQTIVAGAADRWDVSPDGLTYTFHIREGAQWSNGAALTAQDFRESFLRIMDPQIASEDAGYTYGISGARDFLSGHATDPASVGIRTDGANTLVIKLDYRVPYLLRMLAWNPFYPVYMPSLDANGGRHQRGGAWTRPGVLVSNGPFILNEWRENVFVGVKRNPKFWDAGKERLSEIRFYPTEDEGAEERAFRAGQLHVTYSLPESKVAVYEKEQPSLLHLRPILRTNFVSFNVSRAPFSDARVRIAFSLAIDRQRLTHAALGKLGTAAFTWVRPGTAGFNPTSRFRFDPAQAAGLMASAGYPGGTGFPAVEFMLNGNSGATLAVAEVLQQMWLANLGVKVALRPLEFRVYLSVARDRQFQVLLEGYSYSPDPRELLGFGVSDDPNNDSGVRDSSYDAAYKDADRTPEPTLRCDRFDAVEAINAREVYYAPIYFTNRGTLVQTSVRGWRDHGTSAINWRNIYLEPK